MSLETTHMTDQKYKLGNGTITLQLYGHGLRQIKLGLRWSMLTEVSITCRELMKRGCKKFFRNRCKCKHK